MGSAVFPRAGRGYTKDFLRPDNKLYNLFVSPKRNHPLTEVRGGAGRQCHALHTHAGKSSKLGIFTLHNHTKGTPKVTRHSGLK